MIAETLRLSKKIQKMNNYAESCAKMEKVVIPQPRQLNGVCN